MPISTKLIIEAAVKAGPGVVAPSFSGSAKLNEKGNTIPFCNAASLLAASLLAASLPADPATVTSLDLVEPDDVVPAASLPADPATVTSLDLVEPDDVVPDDVEPDDVVPAHAWMMFKMDMGPSYSATVSQDSNF
jgi:hypothetical protein